MEKIEQELTTNKLLLKKLKYLKRLFEEKINQSDEDLKFQKKVVKLIDETEKAIEELKENKNDEVYQIKIEFYDIINDLKNEKRENNNREKPKPIDYKSYNEKCYTKLNHIFRKNKIYSLQEAKRIYDNADFLHNKYVEFLDIINWLNDNGMSIVCEKVLFSGYLNVSVETYNELKYNSSMEVSNVFKSIDEGFTAMQFGALISNDRKSIERIQGVEKYGQEIKTVQADVQITNNRLTFNIDDLMYKRRNALGIQNSKNVIEHKE